MSAPHSREQHLENAIRAALRVGGMPPRIAEVLDAALDTMVCEACGSVTQVADRCDPTWTRARWLLCAPCADAACEARAEGRAA
jgi:hypothetical protein